MNCHQTRELFSEFLDQRLPGAQSAELQAHVGSCPDCRGELEALRATLSLIGTLDEIKPSRDFVTKVERKITRRAWPARLRAWLLEPMAIKIPLEVTALVVISLLAVQVAKSPQFSPDAKAPADLRDLDRDRVSRRADEGKRRSEAAQNYRKSEPQSSTAAREMPPPAAPLKQVGKPAEALKSELSKVQTREIVTDDVKLYQQRTVTLLAEMGGRVIQEEGIEGGGVVLTVELPQSRQEAFFSSWSVGGKAAGALSAGRVRGLVIPQKSEKKALAEERYARSEDESAVTFELRILPQK